ncbi:hypothetical protein [Oligella urethralis]|uniref:hypothetical protein n=1 Tax=Oligella urethralis TaxID=90245 RepID=UPI00288927AF|nr:hypothetical protein [Oligella urethralis]
MVVESFNLKHGSYNVARASAVAQDEVLSLLTQSLVQRLSVIDSSNKDTTEDTIFFMFLSMPHATKLKIDELILNRVFKKGTEHQVTLSDVDALEWNRLRAKALIWNLEGFFTYWADVVSAKKAKPTQ